MTSPASVRDLLRRGDRPAVVIGDVVTGRVAAADLGAGDLTAEIAANVSVSFAELAVVVAELAAGLRARGLGPGDRVAAVLGSSPAFVAIALGALAAGTTFVPLHPGWWPRELEATLDLAAPQLVVADASLGAGPLRHVPHVAVAMPPAKGVASGNGVASSEPLLAALRHPGAALDGPLVAAGAGLVAATSGSTAEPRLFEFSEEQLHRFWSGRPSDDAGGTATGPRVGEATVWTPLAHGPTLRFALRCLLGGTTVVVTHRWTAKRATDGLRRRPTDVLWATTPQLLAVRRRLVTPGRDGTGSDRQPVRRVVYAGGGLTDGLRRQRLTDAFGAPVVSVYTSTEAGGWVTELPDAPDAPAAPDAPRAVAAAGGAPDRDDLDSGDLDGARGVLVGRLATGVVVAGNDERGTAPTDGAAPLYVSGPAAAVHALGGWWRSPAGWPLGDLGVVDGTDVWLVGRSGDRFDCDGHVVDGALVELRLAADERLDDLAVIPRPVPGRGAIGVAVTVPSDPEHPPFLHELHASADPVEGDAPWPEAQWVVDALPLSVAGQVHRRLLTFEESSR